VTYERAPDEWYPEEAWLTTLLLQHIPRPDLVCDPCCGEGNVIAACSVAAIPAFGYDIVDRGAPYLMGLQRFETFASAPAPTVICNPPYEHAEGTERFIRHMLGLPGLETLAVLAEARMMFSVKRASGLWVDHPPRMVLTIAPRPSIPPGEGLRDGTVKRGGGKQDYVWFVWSTRPDCPTGWVAGLRSRGPK
jgi:hypothetical protein